MWSPVFPPAELVPMNLTPELGKLIAVAITSDTKYWLQYLLMVCLATWVKVTRHYMSIFLNYFEEGIAISAQLPVTKNEGNSCFSLTMNSTKARSSLRTETLCLANLPSWYHSRCSAQSCSVEHVTRRFMWKSSFP